MNPSRSVPAAARPGSLPLRDTPAEFLAWARSHQRQERLRAAVLAQITRHPDPNGERDALHQQRAWARRQAREQHLHASAMAQLLHR